MNTLECDPQTGVCSPASLTESAQPKPAAKHDMEVVYVGDPMCSWCWGISPALRQLADFCVAENISFRVVVGGLRPGGGDPWNSQFREFLRHHWQEVRQRTGQPFSTALLDKDFFEYDTEPACRAIVAARPLLKSRELDFFSAVQHKFYVDGEDPKTTSFYEDLCERFGVDFAAFTQRFASPEVRRETLGEFQLNRSWGVSGYPSVLVRHGADMATIAVGFATFEAMKTRVERLRSAAR